MKLQFSVLATLVMIYHTGISQDLVWAKRIGGIDEDRITRMAVDAWGNSYVIGSFYGTAEFEPGPGTFYLNSAGDRDIFISKMDSAGNLVWAKAIGGATFDGGSAIAVDAQGNVYAAGHFEGVVDFDPGPGTYNLTGGISGGNFLLKLDPDGNFIWARTTPVNGAATNIAIDASGNIFCTGGSYQIFVFKLDPSGNDIWVKTMGGGWSGGIASGMAVDASGYSYVIGSFEGVIDFDPGPGVYHLSDSGYTGDVFILRLDPSGNFMWARQIGGTGLDLGLSIAVDAVGNVHAAGFFV